MRRLRSLQTVLVGQSGLVESCLHCRRHPPPPPLSCRQSARLFCTGFAWDCRRHCRRHGQHKTTQLPEPKNIKKYGHLDHVPLFMNGRSASTLTRPLFVKGETATYQTHEFSGGGILVIPKLLVWNLPSLSLSLPSVPFDTKLFERAFYFPGLAQRVGVKRPSPTSTHLFPCPALQDKFVHFYTGWGQDGLYIRTSRLPSRNLPVWLLKSKNKSCESFRKPTCWSRQNRRGLGECFYFKVRYFGALWQWNTNYFHFFRARHEPVRCAKYNHFHVCLYGRVHSNRGGVGYLNPLFPSLWIWYPVWIWSGFKQGGRVFCVFESTSSLTSGDGTQFESGLDSNGILDSIFSPASD